MVDSNKARQRLRQRVVYLTPEEDERIERVLRVSGETFASVTRHALREYVRRMERKLGIDGGGR